MNPDWEWHQPVTFLTSYGVYASQVGNWQRSGGRGERPKLITPQLLRGDQDLDLSNVNSAGVASGSRQGHGIAVHNADDLARAADELAARRRKKNAS